MKMLLFATIWALLTLAVFAAPTLPSSDLAKRASYGLRCNANNLKDEWIQDQIKKMAWLGKYELTEEVGKRGKNLEFMWNKNPPAKVSLRIWTETGFEITKTRVRFENVKKGLEKLKEVCGPRGGSMQVPNEPAVIVHLNKNWV